MTDSRNTDKSDTDNQETESEMPPFTELGLPDTLLRALQDVGYERPSPIQAASIPPLLQGSDLLGQAQTGTGKTAAFALPLLANIDLKKKSPQLLVLCPTRELAIQVAEAFQSYARYLPGFHVLPVYGGQGFDSQLRGLKRGAHVVVGTPGRVMDHMRRKTLKLETVNALVLDEADEMLRMGFIDDVEWILESVPEERQIALFSATMPAPIKKVADRYLREPEEIKIAAKTTTAATIRQRVWTVSGTHKLDALTRILEAESFDAVLVFVRTKTATVELSEKLSARGFACEALNGDMSQQLRERMVDRLKSGKLDILVGTDVVARGLDVERISHVVNYDIPYDAESYVHRIGRTGRAGRAGEAILFVAPRERRLLKAIEKTTKQPIESMELPSVGDINQRRIERFKQRIRDVLAQEDLQVYEQLLAELQHEEDIDPLRLTAALALMSRNGKPLLLDEPKPKKEKSERKKKQASELVDVDKERFWINVGREHGVKPGNIVGAIANEADLDSRYIGEIDIEDDHSFVELPVGMPDEVLQVLKNAVVCQRPLAMVRAAGGGGKKRSSKPHRGKKAKPARRGNDGGGKKKPRRQKQ